MIPKEHDIQDFAFSVNASFCLLHLQHGNNIIYFYAPRTASSQTFSWFKNVHKDAGSTFFMIKGIFILHGKQNILKMMFWIDQSLSKQWTVSTVVVHMRPKYLTLLLLKNSLLCLSFARTSKMYGRTTWEDSLVPVLIYWHVLFYFIFFLSSTTAEKQKYCAVPEALWAKWCSSSVHWSVASHQRSQRPSVFSWRPSASSSPRSNFSPAPQPPSSSSRPKHSSRHFFATENWHFISRIAHRQSL